MVKWKHLYFSRELRLKKNLGPFYKPITTQLFDAIVFLGYNELMPHVNYPNAFPWHDVIIHGLLSSGKLSFGLSSPPWLNEAKRILIYHKPHNYKLWVIFAYQANFDAIPEHWKSVSLNFMCYRETLGKTQDILYYKCDAIIAKFTQFHEGLENRKLRLKLTTWKLLLGFDTIHGVKEHS